MHSSNSKSLMVLKNEHEKLWSKPLMVIKMNMKIVTIKLLRLWSKSLMVIKMSMKIRTITLNP